MATYAIGDVHGCFATLQALLARIAYSPGDRLWLVGDLVNRGPQSLAVLRWAADQGDDRLVVTLGNHDLHLLARAAGVAERKRRDTLDAVLTAPDRDELLAWLRRRPLLHREGETLLVHAGLFPQWSVEEAEGLAREAEERLRGRTAGRLLRAAAGKRSERWRRGLTPGARVRVAVAGMVRLRALTADGRMCADWSGPPSDLPPGCRPWFELPDRRSAGARIVCGHWAALGLRLEPGIAAIDTGCVWGQRLTALRLDDGKVFQEPARE